MARAFKYGAAAATHGSSAVQTVGLTVHGGQGWVDEGCDGWGGIRRNSSNTYQHPSGRPAVTRSMAASPECILLTSTTSPGWRGRARLLSSKRTHLARWRAPCVPATTTSGSSTAMMVRRASRAYGSGSTGLALVTDSGPATDGLRAHPPGAGRRRRSRCASRTVCAPQRWCSGSREPGWGWDMRAPEIAISNKYTWSLQAAPVTGPSTNISCASKSCPPDKVSEIPHRCKGSNMATTDSVG
jgi:hypothetical protein